MLLRNPKLFIFQFKWFLVVISEIKFLNFHLLCWWGLGCLKRIWTILCIVFCIGVWGICTVHQGCILVAAAILLRWNIGTGWRVPHHLWMSWYTGCGARSSVQAWYYGSWSNNRPKVWSFLHIFALLKQLSLIILWWRSLVQRSTQRAMVFLALKAILWGVFVIILISVVSFGAFVS